MPLDGRQRLPYRCGMAKQTTPRSPIKLRMFDFMTPAQRRRVKTMARDAEMLKRLAYKVAEAICPILGTQQAIDILRTRSVDEWFYEEFAPAMALGCEPRELVWAVNRGMTLDEFMGTPGWRTPPEVWRRIRDKEKQEKADRAALRKASAGRKA